MKFVSYLDTPLGGLQIVSNGEGLQKISLFSGKRSQTPEDGITREAAAQLSEYFAGKRKVFDLPLSPCGTAFEHSVWAELLKIPFGSSKSYGQIAADIGKPRASRAVGNAVGKNPLLIVIPCHRVLAANHKLGGFSAGIENKRYLLSHEGIPLCP